MEYGLLALISLVLGGGVAGGLLNAWSVHRRLLALEENLKVILGAYDDRMNQIQKIITRQDKTAAAEARWGKKDIELEKIKALATPNAAPHPWDPRTWGSNGG
jgi:hypothetical protein